jgi:O-antigen/teichoic acid export membrane protein
VLSQSAINKVVLHGRSLAGRARGFNWFLLDQIVVSGANFLTSAIVARALGIETFGIFSLAWMMVQFVQSVQSAAILLPMMSVGPKQSPEEAKSYYAVSMFHQLVWTFGSAVLIWAGSLAAARLGLGVEAEKLAVPLFVSVLVTQMHEFLRRYGFTVGRVKQVVFSDVIRYGSLMASLLYAAVFAPTKPDSSGVLYLMSISAVLATISVWSIAPSVRGFRARLVEVSLRHFNAARWMTGSALLLWITSNFFIVAAGSVLGTAAVGAIRAASSLMQVTNLFFQAAEGFAPPTAARIFHTDGIAGLKKFIRQMIVVALAVTIAATVVLGLPGSFWLKLVFGAEFGDYGWAVFELGLSFVILSITQPMRFAFQAIESMRVDFTGYIYASLWTLATSYLAAQYFGLHGVIISYLVGQLILMWNLRVTYVKLGVKKAAP